MRKRIIAVALAAAGIVAGLVASAPASAATVKCRPASTLTDRNIPNLVSATYRLPSGHNLTVTRQTDVMTAGYAVERGTLVQVCMAGALRW